MFDIGWTEMLVIAIVLIVVVGPKDLPKMLRTFGRTTAKLRAMAGDFRRQFDEALKEAELDEVKNLADDVRKLNPTADIRKALNPMQKAAEDIRTGLDAAMNPGGKKAEVAPPAAVPPVAVPAEPAKAGPAAMPGEAARPAPPKNGHDASAAPNAARAAAAAGKAAPAAKQAKPAAPKRKAAAATKTGSKT